MLRKAITLNRTSVDNRKPEIIRVRWSDAVSVSRIVWRLLRIINAEHDRTAIRVVWCSPAISDYLENLQLDDVDVQWMTKF